MGIFEIPLMVRVKDPATEVSVLDGSFQLVEREPGEVPVHFDEVFFRYWVRPGVYKLRFRLGNALQERLEYVPAGKDGMEVAAPLLRIATPVPLERASSVRDAHMEAAYAYSRVTHVRLGAGSQLFVFAHSSRSERGRHPARGLSLCALDGQPLVSFSKEGEADKESDAPWSACNIELAPGPYLLRITTKQRVVEQVVVASDRWQTQIFLGPPPFENELDAGLDVANAAILVAPPGFQPNDKGALLTEAARQVLAENRPITFESSWGHQQSSPLAPMLSLFSAYSQVAHPDLDHARWNSLEDKIRWLQGGLGDHPDVEALKIAIDGKTRSLSVPPMLHLGWRFVVGRTLSRPGLVPAGSLAARCATSRWGQGVWLAWSREHPEAVPRARSEDKFTAVEAAARELVPRRSSRPSRLPAWSEGPDPLRSLSGTEVARALQLPVSVAEETVGALWNKHEKVRRERTARRQELLARPDVPVCRVVLPTGVRPDPTGLPAIDFDRIYEEAIEPAVLGAGMVPVRVTPELMALAPHEALQWPVEGPVLVELSTRSAESLFELGVGAWLFEDVVPLVARRHKVPLLERWSSCLEYDLGAANRFTEREAEQLRQLLGESLKRVPGDWVRAAEGREQVRSHLLRMERLREQLTEARAREDGGDALRRVERQLHPMDAPDAEVLIELFLSYRALKDWEGMIRLAEAMPEKIQRLFLVREQWAFALNQSEQGRGPSEHRRRASDLLESLLREYGPNPETCGLLGSLYRGIWEETLESSPEMAPRFLRLAIDRYLQGFSSAWRDYAPGMDALLLLEVQGDELSLLKKEQLLPVVRFALEQQCQGPRLNYRDHAAMLELAVLNEEQELAQRHLRFTLASVTERTEPEATARNLRLIMTAQLRRSRWLRIRWLEELIQPLEERSRRPA
ncbi:TRAFs-binding domain-containing protein [Hyalangium sp.]|uniref:TRAFs-binding domain-containing protein n=1 Tax=Hyalangium sp. TaxID=2028555 RepID=UPI002D72182D|nr:TRAFs-binding domain-containing protein [Hyalangium sp.]HYH99336.1 TRAFs-binding domain-containing protein [Hyalangium sp.]